jgi:pSer/pThr/pTyr-binding forkhead associated (FHA) protein
MITSFQVANSDPWEDEATTSAGIECPLPSVRRPGKPYLLRQVQGPGAPRQYVLDLSEIVVGRSLQAHISVDSHLLSRRHIVLKKSGPEYVCHDLDSKNGMYLNGVRAHSAVLREGDTIQLGDVVLVYDEGS